MAHYISISAALFLTLATGSFADGPQDNSVANVRSVPPVGIELTAEQTQMLQARLDRLSAAIEELRQPQFGLANILLPDVEVFHRAVSQALYHQEMFDERDVNSAVALLDLADTRAAELKTGKAPWTTQHGLVVRGFRSALDGTVQPYGLEIASDYNFEHVQPVRCDIWFHGRGERSMELQFLAQRNRGSGPYPPQSGIVLHPYGRYSNAFKFAGEVDTLEALAHVKQHYNIDPDRISVRGFSMGGAACWQFAVHYPDRWFAANPGAGFSETPRFLQSFQGETLNPPWYEEKLWRMYDCDLWAENLRQLPTVAYSGEIDRQKQAADVMEEALEKHHIDLMHVIGPETAHKIHPDSNQIIREKFDHLAARGRQQFPDVVKFTTYTLKYNQMNWLTVHGLKEHWEQSHIEARAVGDFELIVKTDGVTEFSINFPAGRSPFDLQNDVTVMIDGQPMPGHKTMSDGSFNARFHLSESGWTLGSAPQATPFRKAHNLQGPVDDALMSSFLFVKPSGKAVSAEVQKWIDSELNRAVKEWRRQMRGDVRIKVDSEVTEEDISEHHLILWGTPDTNSVMSKVAPQLPVKWNSEGVQLGDLAFDADVHVPILVHPNPLNPQKYVVFNSSFTYREYDYLNNARQTPKLPDWAIIDVRTPPNARWPGKIVAADFFDENWQIKPTAKK